MVKALRLILLLSGHHESSYLVYDLRALAVGRASVGWNSDVCCVTHDNIIQAQMKFKSISMH